MRFVAAVMAMLMAATSAFGAVSIQYDQNVTSAGNLYFGNGNANGDFTTGRNVESGIELGLRTHVRFPASATTLNNHDGTYGSFAAQGYTTPPSAGVADPFGLRASWNFDFSINSDYTSGATNLSAYQYVLSMDYDPGYGVSYLSFNPLAFPITDNGYGTNLAKVLGGDSTNTNVAQNSEQLNFFTGVPPGHTFDPFASGLYDIRLQAFSGETLLDEVTIHVTVGDGASVPEPASMAVWGGLSALGWVIGRRKKLFDLV